MRVIVEVWCKAKKRDVNLGRGMMMSPVSVVQLSGWGRSLVNSDIPCVSEQSLLIPQLAVHTLLKLQLSNIRVPWYHCSFQPLLTGSCFILWQFALMISLRSFQTHFFSIFNRVILIWVLSKLCCTNCNCPWLLLRWSYNFFFFFIFSVKIHVQNCSIIFICKSKCLRQPGCESFNCSSVPQRVFFFPCKIHNVLALAVWTGFMVYF